MGYVLVNFGMWVAVDLGICKIVGVALEIVVLVDIVMEIVAIRFWGKYSFCCHKAGKKQNALFSILIIVLHAWYLYC